MGKIKAMKSYADLLAELKNRADDTRPELNPFPLTQDRPKKEEPALRQIYDSLSARPVPRQYGVLAKRRDK